MSPQTQAGLDYSKVDEILSSYEYKKSNLIAILQKVQEEFRYLQVDVMTYIGTKIEGLSPATVYGVATFNAQFSLQPKGKKEVKVCDGTACHVRGSMPVLNAIHQCLKLVDGKFTTEDGLFSEETVSCLGACGLAPDLTVNDKVYPCMTPDKATELLEQLKEEG